MIGKDFVVSRAMFESNVRRHRSKSLNSSVKMNKNLDRSWSDIREYLVEDNKGDSHLWTWNDRDFRTVTGEYETEHLEEAT